MGQGGSCDVPGYDGDLLELLSPTPLESNSSMTIAKVLSLAPKQAWEFDVVATIARSEKL